MTLILPPHYQEQLREEPFVTMREAEKILKADTRTIRKWLESGLLQGYKRPDGRILIATTTIYDCLKSLHTTPTHT